MSEQFLAMYEETTRGTKPGVPVHRFLPVTKGLAPKYAPKDEPRKEFRGADTALGDSSVVRKDSQYTASPECFLYPGVELGLMLKHLFGFAGIRAVVDTTAYRGLLYPVKMPYGSGASLGDKAIALVPNIEREGASASQDWNGARIKSATLSFKQGEDITISFEMQGPGPWVGAANQAATAGVSFPITEPYSFADAAFYIGAGAVRTGVAPDFTNLDPGTMVRFVPDDFTIKIINGLDDKITGNGVKGPSKTERVAQFSYEVDFTIDFADPGAGFSTIDEFEAQFSGPRTASIMTVLSHPELAGSVDQNYQEIIDQPLMQLKIDSPDPDNEGKQVKVKCSGKSLAPGGGLKPIHWMTVDKATAY